MKTAKLPANGAEPSSSRRSQPVRQTRTNPPRNTTGLGRSYPRDSFAAGGVAHDQPIDIFPAVTHFADAITALPKELVKHFTLLKEVDAKVHQPEQGLFQLVDAALNAPPPDQSRSLNDASSSIAPASAPMSVQNSSTGVARGGPVPPGASNDESLNASVFDLSNLPRRQLFRQAAFDIKEMLVSLEEKNHVISTANEALQKELGRIDEVWPYLMDEFSEEAKWGSNTHWAYAENRAARASNAQAERSRREGAASLSAAAQQLAEEAAARSDARKQAVAAKRSNKTQQHQESDFDDHEKHKSEGTKKTGTSKSRKALTQSASTAGGVAPNNATGENNPTTTKRRKVEKPTNGNAPTEKAMASVLGSTAAKTKPSSPRETPAPESAPKKRKALPTGGNPTKKRNPTGTTPSATASPVIGALPDKPSARASPAPSVPARPVSSRARQNSTQSNVDTVRQPRPSSAASNKPNISTGSILPELAPHANGNRAASENKIIKESTAVAKNEEPKPLSEPPAPKPPAAIPVSDKKDVPAKVDEAEPQKEPTPTVPTPQTVTTKSGRASKPSTPALATFAEAARSRPSRAGENGAAPKRSHKKGASAAAAAQALAAQLADESANNSKQEEEDDEDPLYCYCNGVSYGEMIACDAEDCAKEWFHLECVGLKVAPKGNAKWYCEDCKKRLKMGDRKSSVR